MKSLLLLLALTLSFVSGAKLFADGDRPNILYLYVDDMGWGSIGPNAQAQRRANNLPSVRTPNLDQLAAQGVNFTRGYGCHVCSPARSSQQSGFHQGHTYSDRNDPNNAKKAMRAEDVLMGDVLSSAGYVTGYWGKWGYGGSKDQNNPVIENIQTLPTSHGYQHVLAELHHVRAHTFFQPTLWSAPASKGSIGGLELVPSSLARFQNNAAYPNGPALQNHADYPDTAYCDDAYAFAALDFVRDQGQKYNQTGQPFFGLLAVQIPHAPFGEIVSLPDWDKAYANDPHYGALADQTRQWAAMVTRIDAHFGNILAALEDPNNDGDRSDSIADNTLVIFQSDNGGPGGKNNIELDANGGLTGTKGKIQEGGIRVPLLMRWPAKITAQSKLRAGTDSDMIVDVTDLMPTFCDLAGAPTPLGLDGVSIAPTLSGRGHQRHREFIIHEAGNGQSIIRGTHKLVRTKNAPLKLYDLDVDRTESNDLAAGHPQLVKELESLLLGERVAEPKGFANTYHHWTGDDDGDAADAGNWSDYHYANAGITYMTDDGAPRLSWTARLENEGDEPNTAQANTDLEFLALEIRGNKAAHAGQSLVLGSGVNLVGRNAIRLSSHATLAVNKGTISSLRWVDIKADAVLTGSGTIDSTVFNDGVLQVTGDSEPAWYIDADYHQSATGRLEVILHAEKQPILLVGGDVTLAGILAVTPGKGFKATPGSSYTVCSGNRVAGTFANPDDEVITADGTRLAIGYSESAVTLTVK